MRTVAWLLVFVLGAPALAAAQPPTPPRIPAGDDRIVALRRGEPAPFDGQLLDTDTAIRWTYRLEWYDSELQRQYQLRLDGLRVLEESWELRLSVVEESYTREVEGLRGDTRRIAGQLAAARNPGFFRTTAGGFVIGVGVSALAVVVGAVLYAR